MLLTTVVSLWYLATRTESSFSSWSLPQYLKDIGLSSSSSRARLVSDAKTEAGRPRVEEIHGVLHFVTAYPDRTLNEADGAINVEGLGPVEVDPSKPVDLRVYAPDGNDLWSEHIEVLQTKHPLVIFSKSYCPYVSYSDVPSQTLLNQNCLFCCSSYSQRAKALLASQNLKPSATIIELDQRADGPILQAILKRLTGRGTVPNIILQVRQSRDMNYIPADELRVG